MQEALFTVSFDSSKNRAVPARYAGMICSTIEIPTTSRLALRSDFSLEIPFFRPIAL
jgi:hypothetical protein